MKLKGLPQAVGVAFYCGLVGYFMFNISSIFGKNPSFLGPATFLVLFSLSALICTLIVFYEPYKLFFSGKQKQALEVVVSTTIWLAVFFVIFLLTTLVTKK